MSFFGVIVTGFCIGAFQKANLGADPFTCFVTGIANIFHSTYSTFYIIVTGALLVGVFFVEKHYIGIATVINLFFTGMAADFMRNILDNIFPAPGMAARLVMMLFGIFGTCFAASVYFTADLGVSAYDAWSLIAANKYKLMPFRLCRIASDSVCVLTGGIIQTYQSRFCMDIKELNNFTAMLKAYLMGGLFKTGKGEVSCFTFPDILLAG